MLPPECYLGDGFSVWVCLVSIWLPWKLPLPHLTPPSHPHQMELGISLDQTVVLAGHLVYWGKAQVVTKIRRSNVYRVRVACVACVWHACGMCVACVWHVCGMCGMWGMWGMCGMCGVCCMCGMCGMCGMWGAGDKYC